MLGISFVWCLVGDHSTGMHGELRHIGEWLLELAASGLGRAVVCHVFSGMILHWDFCLLNINFELINGLLEHALHFLGLSWLILHSL